MKIRALVASLLLLFWASLSLNAQTLDDTRASGVLKCGINTGLVGFAYPDEAGNWKGFDVDYCRAVAAAVLGDPDAVEYTPLTGKQRFTALAAGQVDVLSRNTTWTFSRDTDLKQTFAGINYYDGQGFMVHASSGVMSAYELSGAAVCIQTGTTTELNLADFFRANNMAYDPVPIETNAEAKQQFFAEACDVYTTDRSGLAATRASHEDPDSLMVLPEIISKEPLGPLVRHGDDQWADIARWVLNALITAEEKGLTMDNVMSMGDSNDPEVRRLLGTEGELASFIGLDSSWAANAIAAVGNYGEIFERHIGVNTAIGLERGHNALWTDGGLIYSPPFR